MQDVWKKTTENLEKVLSERDFSTWIRPVAYNRSENDTVYLSVPTSFFKEWLEDHYLSVLSSALSVAAGRNLPRPRRLGIHLEGGTGKVADQEKEEDCQ